jgi:hypothetical protein
MRLFISIAVVSLLLISCNSKLDVNNADAIVKVRNKILYKSELKDNIPSGISSEDSILTSEHFIRLWINDVLLYDIASKNVYDKEKIERLVNNYRKSLVIYQYQEQLINEKLTAEIDNQTLLDYYNENKEKFKLDRPLVKGIFLKVPVNAPQIENVRTWYKSTTPDSREKMEKYSVYNAVKFSYFTDYWVDFNELMANCPLDYYNNQEAIISNNRYIEQRDSSYYYFLNITSFLLEGDNAPFEFAKPRIQELLINQKRIDFLKQTEKDIYQRAIKKGEIKFYNE